MMLFEQRQRVGRVTGFYKSAVIEIFVIQLCSKWREERIKNLASGVPPVGSELDNQGRSQAAL